MHYIPPIFAKPDVFINDSENTESIYQIIPAETPVPVKQKRYVSKHKDMVLREWKERLDSHRTMGYEKTPLALPSDFLKKHTKEPKLPLKKPFQYPDSDKSKPPVPSVHDRPRTANLPVKDFVLENARKATRMAKPRFVQKQVDTKTGDWMELEPAGLLPKYTRKKEYGLVPKYLMKRNEDMLKSEEMIKNFVAEEYRKNDLPRVTDEEKAFLLEGLRNNWKELNRIYLSLPLVTDTSTRIWTKEELERRLGRLERDIDVIERYQNIYIAPPNN